LYWCQAADDNRTVLDAAGLSEARSKAMHLPVPLDLEPYASKFIVIGRKI
jgi:hypothetical protein